MGSETQTNNTIQVTRGIAEDVSQCNVNEFRLLFSKMAYSVTMLSGSLVTTAWRVLRLRMEEMASRYRG
jgi:hypothetical protein